MCRDLDINSVHRSHAGFIRVELVNNICSLNEHVEFGVIATLRKIFNFWIGVNSKSIVDIEKSKNLKNNNLKNIKNNNIFFF